MMMIIDPYIDFGVSELLSFLQIFEMIIQIILRWFISIIYSKYLSLSKIKDQMVIFIYTRIKVETEDKSWFYGKLILAVQNKKES